MPAWAEALQRFFQDIDAGGDGAYFNPHPTDTKSLERLAGHRGRDLYYVLIEQGKVLGYGLLRGWDEGYEIPSLGLAIHPTARGQGLGRMMMKLLHVLAIRQGARHVRLRVRVGNTKALGLYQSLGYRFEPDANDREYLIGFKYLHHE